MSPQSPAVEPLTLTNSPALQRSLTFLSSEHRMSRPFRILFFQAGPDLHPMTTTVLYPVDITCV
jgi:hypothetical protein